MTSPLRRAAEILRCWWFGCDPEPAYPPDNPECVRCGGYIEYSDLVGDTRHYRAMERLRLIRYLVWPRKCVDCGRRWKRCDESVDHIPF